MNFDPQIYIDITDYTEKKRKALSEFKLMHELVRKREGGKGTEYADLILSLNRTYGYASAVPYAEAFREFYCIETKSRAVPLLPI